MDGAGVGVAIGLGVAEAAGVAVAEVFGPLVLPRVPMYTPTPTTIAATTIIMTITYALIACAVFPLKNLLFRISSS